VRVDLVSIGADAAIRIGPMLDSALIARKLAPHRRIACASVDYLASRSPLRKPDDLLQHDCLIYSLQPSHNWFFVDSRGKQTSVPVHGRLRADDSEPLQAAALDGLGVVLLPSWLVGDDIRAGRLVRVLPDWHAMIATQPSGIFWALPAASRGARQSPRVSRFPAAEVRPRAILGSGSVAAMTLMCRFEGKQDGGNSESVASPSASERSEGAFKLAC
jgi:transcriptional regulator, LysR family